MRHCPISSISGRMLRGQLIGSQAWLIPTWHIEWEQFKFPRVERARPGRELVDGRGPVENREARSCEGGMHSAWSRGESIWVLMCDAIAIASPSSLSPRGCLLSPLSSSPDLSPASAGPLLDSLQSSRSRRSFEPALALSRALLRLLQFFGVCCLFFAFVVVFLFCKGLSLRQDVSPSQRPR